MDGDKETEKRFKSALRQTVTTEKTEETPKKSVTFAELPEGTAGEPGTKIPDGSSPRQPSTTNWTDKTGGDSYHTARGPQSRSHPLRNRTSPDERSIALGEELVDSTLGKKKKPGMAGSLLVGDNVETSTSMRQGTLALHPVVAAVLKELADSGGPKGRGHGQCSEVGTISNHLWEIDPGGTMTLVQAQAYFEKRGAVTVAHRPTSEDAVLVTPACASCEYLTNKLCVATISDDPPKKDEW